MSETLQSRLIKLREARGWTQTELSKRAKLSVSAISQFESGQRTPSFEALRKLAEAFEVETDFIFGRVAEQEPVKAMPEFQTMYRKLNNLPEEERAQAVKILKGVLDVHHPSND